VLAAELTSVYHAIKHNHSYASTDCLNKLVHQQFSDSEIAKKATCGRTKSEALVKEVLGPKFLNDVLCDLKLRPAYFGLCCDAPNRRNRKLFPVVLTYFTPNGRKTALIDFYEDRQENAMSIFDLMQSTVSNNCLDIRTCRQCQCQFWEEFVCFYPTDRNALFDELVLLQNITPLLLSSEMSVEERWVKVFKSVDKTKLTNIFQIISFVLGIAASIAVVERVFSVMNSKCSDTRNTASVELIRNELFVYFNCSLTCLELQSSTLTVW